MKGEGKKYSEPEFYRKFYPESRSYYNESSGKFGKFVGIEGAGKWVFGDGEKPEVDKSHVEKIYRFYNEINTELYPLEPEKGGEGYGKKLGEYKKKVEKIRKKYGMAPRELVREIENAIIEYAATDFRYVVRKKGKIEWVDGSYKPKEGERVVELKSLAKICDELEKRTCGLVSINPYRWVRVMFAMESNGFDPKASSIVGAGGIAQIMPDTAKFVGLEVSMEKDERKDPDKCIMGGLRYYTKLVNEIYALLPPDAKEFCLFIGAMGYNGGPGAVGKTRGKEMRLVKLHSKYTGEGAKEYLWNEFSSKSTDLVGKRRDYWKYVRNYLRMIYRWEKKYEECMGGTLIQ